MRKTKIICTIGPTSEREEILEEMILSGMDIARINTSHSDRAEVITLVKRIRKISKRTGKNTAIILDLQGPKIRIGELSRSILLKSGQDIIFYTGKTNKNKKSGRELMIQVGYSRFIDDIRKGVTIFIDDGLIECKVLKIDEENKSALCSVITGGTLSSHKGINLPGVSVSIKSITEKDLEFLKLGLELEVDFIAQSFVRSKADIRTIRNIINKAGSPVRIISKIEKHEAVKAFEEILEVSDAIMIARGDLGIEIDAEFVPVVQKRIIKRSNLEGKPVITATQMLNSMIENPRPTRAEVSDVANAILDGSDAVMLSGETAAGSYPLKSLDMMVRVIIETEKTLDYGLISQNNAILRKKLDIPHNTTTEAISYASCEIAAILDADAIISSTESGATARQVSKNRPGCMIIGTSPNQYVVRQLMLSWGVIPLKTVTSKNIDSMIEEDIKVSLETGYIQKGSRVIITAGVMVNEPGSTNLINVREVK
ncbi:MAG TPA: pyruvate kinase [Actinobacteria bacterium]|nr:pyruvate kinase [Actinomycetota bacterium]